MLALHLNSCRRYVPYLHGPYADEDPNVQDLRKVLQMVPQGNDSEDYEANMEVEEKFVEGAAEDGGGLYNNRHEGNESLGVVSTALSNPAM